MNASSLLDVGNVKLGSPWSVWVSVEYSIEGHEFREQPMSRYSWNIGFKAKANVPLLVGI